MATSGSDTTSGTATVAAMTTTTWEARTVHTGPGTPARLDPWVPLRTLRPTGIARFAGGAYTKEVAAALSARCQLPFPRPMTIAVVSLKGGVGKSYLTMGVANTLCLQRHEMVAFVDADPDAATGNVQFGGTTDRNWLRMLSEAARDPHVYQSIRRDPSAWASTAIRLADVESSHSTGIDVYGSPPNAMERHRVMAGRHLIGLWKLLGFRYWSRTVDTGTALADLTSLPHAAVESADALIIATSTAAGDLVKGRETRRTLTEMGFDRLARSATVAAWMRPGATSGNQADEEDRVRRDYFPDGGDTQVQEIIAVPHDRDTTGGVNIDATNTGAATSAAITAVTASAVTAALGNIRR